jgi:phosphoribosylamine-glycine ligase
MNKVSKFLIISEGGDGSGLALRLKEEGHNARIWIRDAEAEKRCHGLIDTADEYSFGATVVADCTGAGTLLDTYREAGIPTVGGCSLADKLEADRGFSEEVFRTARIDTPESHRASTWAEASEMAIALGGEKGKVVLKPEGRFSGVVPSYVTYDAADSQAMLKHFRGIVGDEIELTIQEYVPGVAVSTEGWFDGNDWVIGMFNHTIERKQFLNGDLGPSGGCTGNLVWPCGEEDPLVRELLTPLTKFLQTHQYKGAIDVNAVVNEEGAYALEFTPRFGYDAFPTLLVSLAQFDFGRFLDSLARGYPCNESLTEGFGAGVRITIPPWPSEKFHAEEHVPVNGLSERSREWFYPMDVQLSTKGDLETSGGYGIIGVVNGFGNSIDDAFEPAYKIAGKLRLPNKQYRTDLAEACKADFNKLQRIFSGELINA